jgi:hypothetical protein
VVEDVTAPADAETTDATPGAADGDTVAPREARPDETEPQAAQERSRSET